MCWMFLSAINIASIIRNCLLTRTITSIGLHINGIENFRNLSKRHPKRYNGIHKEHFHLVLKEGEWRFNYRPVANLNKTLQQWSFKSKSKLYLCQTLKNMGHQLTRENTRRKFLGRPVYSSDLGDAAGPSNSEEFLLGMVYPSPPTKWIIAFCNATAEKSEI